MVEFPTVFKYGNNKNCKRKNKIIINNNSNGKNNKTIKLQKILIRNKNNIKIKIIANKKNKRRSRTAISSVHEAHNKIERSYNKSHLKITEV